jgi:hypothetical protein
MQHRLAWVVSFASLVSKPRPSREGSYGGLTEGGDAGDALADY